MYITVCYVCVCSVHFSRSKDVLTVDVYNVCVNCMEPIQRWLINMASKTTWQFWFNTLVCYEKISERNSQMKLVPVLLAGNQYAWACPSHQWNTSRTLCYCLPSLWPYKVEKSCHNLNWSKSIEPLIDSSYMILHDRCLHALVINMCNNILMLEVVLPIM